MLKIGDRVRMKPDAPGRELLFDCFAGIVSWVGEDGTINVDLDDGTYAQGTVAAEWERQD